MIFFPSTFYNGSLISTKNQKNSVDKIILQTFQHSAEYENVFKRKIKELMETSLSQPRLGGTRRSKMKPKNQEKEFEFFDDCPICQAMKEGKNSLEELKEAFKEAEKQGAIVGGKWFEEEEK